MGCSGSSNPNQMLKNEFIKSANKFRRVKTKGVCLEDKDRTKTMKLWHSSSLTFDEELNFHADESGLVKPWLESIVCPDYEIKENLDAPKYNIQIDHVFGYRVEDINQNLYFFGSEEIIYMSGSLGIIQNINDLSQTLFGGFKRDEERECHDGDIMALAFLKDEISMVATGQRGMKPKIYVWSPHDTSIIYAKFFLPKGTNEVSTLEFTRNGHYLVATGKDLLNSIFVFDMRTKSMVYSSPTNAASSELNNEPSLQFIIDTYSSRDSNEFCFVGVNKIFFMNVFPPFNLNINNNLSNIIEKKKNNRLVVYTSACYFKDNKWIIGNDRGKMLEISKDSQKGTYYMSHKTNVSNGSIYNIIYSKLFNKFYISDSYGNVFIYSEMLLEISRYSVDSPCKCLDVNDNEEVLMGLINGSIVIKYLKDKNKKEEVILKSHSKGSIRGLDYIPDNRIVTVGDDNKIMIWNLRSKKCENEGEINPFSRVLKPEKSKFENKNEDKDITAEEYMNIDKKLKSLDKNKKKEEQKKEIVYIDHPNTQSSCVSYNKINFNIAVGTNDGKVTIRKGPKHLQERVVPDIDIKKCYTKMKQEETGKEAKKEENKKILYYATTELKYTNDGIFLLATTEEGYIMSFDVTQEYRSTAYYKLYDDYIIRFDFDNEYNYIQTVTRDNKYLFFKITDFKDIEPEKSSECIKKLDFPNITCKFGFTVQGVYMGSTDPSFISAVGKANAKNIISSGDDDNFLNLYNYPCICENPKVKSFKGHCGHIMRIIFSPNDDKIITIAEDDKVIILWNLVPEK